MASFQAKISWKIMRQRESKNYRSVSSSTRNRKFKKNSKKIQKIPLWHLFKSKIRWRRPRKRENKNYCSDLFLNN